MKSMKKLLVAFVLLASVIVFVGCDTNAGDTPSKNNVPTEQPTGDKEKPLPEQPTGEAEEEKTPCAKGEHTGGTATCTTKAKCSECGAEYGEFNPENHESEGFTYIKHDENTHIKKRVCCDEHVIENCSYSEELCICEKKVDVNESKTTDFHNAWDDGWTDEEDLE